MKKINLIGIEFVVLLVLILIPFSSCAGSGTPTGTQNLCGDGFCQPTETAASCPIDCQGVSQGQPSLSTQSQISNSTNNSSINQPSGVQNNPPINQPTTNQSATGNNTSVNQPASTGNLPTQNSFFAGTAFKIILVIIILIVLGIIAYLVLRNKNKTNPNPAVSN